MWTYHYPRHHEVNLVVAKKDRIEHFVMVKIGPLAWETFKLLMFCVFFLKLLPSRQYYL